MRARQATSALVLLVTAMVSGCARPSSPPERPVQAPGVTVPAPAPTPAPKPPDPPPTQPSSVEAPQQPVAQPPAAAPGADAGSEPEDTRPKATEPPTITPLPAAKLPEGAPALLKQLADANWQFEAIKQTLPPLESKYGDSSGENANYTTLAYSQGDLRLFVGGGGTVFALLVGPAYADFKSFQSLQPGLGYSVHKAGKFVGVTRFTPVSEQEFERLNAAKWTEELLRTGLGSPTYSTHHHGLGSRTYTWFPLGLSFHGYPGELTQTSTSFPKYQERALKIGEGFIQGEVGELTYIEGLLAKGKASPNQKAYAAVLQRGGYWDNWIIIKREGKAELRYQADYFIADYTWLDDQTVLYTIMAGAPLYAIHLDTGERRLVTNLQGSAKKLGVVADRKIWYETEEGQRFEFEIPK